MFNLNADKCIKHFLALYRISLKTFFKLSSIFLFLFKTSFANTLIVIKPLETTLMPLVGKKK